LFLQRAESWAAPGLPDLRAQLRKLLVEGSVWDPAPLRDLATVLESSRSTRSAIQKQREAFPLLAEIAQHLVELPQQEEAILRAIGDDGEVKDTASRELGRLRKEIRSARSRIVEKLEQFMAQLPARVQVQDASVSLREGRYVVPVRREGRADVGGIVHD